MPKIPFETEGQLNISIPALSRELAKELANALAAYYVTDQHPVVMALDHAIAMLDEGNWTVARVIIPIA